MALKKNIASRSGLTLGYHRISQLDLETNVMVAIWVRSYVSQQDRQGEVESGETTYHEDTYVPIELDYADAPKDVDVAYGWLKEQPEFADAEDC